MDHEQAVMNRRCPSCGKEIPSGNTFCPFCGSKQVPGVSWRQRIPLPAVFAAAGVVMLAAGFLLAPVSSGSQLQGTYRSEESGMPFTLTVSDLDAVLSGNSTTYTGTAETAYSGSVWRMTLADENGNTVFLTVCADEDGLMVFEKISSAQALRYRMQKVMESQEVEK